MGIEKINVTKWLRNNYEKDLNPNIAEVVFYQSDDDVWMIVEYNYETEFGVKSIAERVYLQYVPIPYEQVIDLNPKDVKPYRRLPIGPENSIEENVSRLLMSKEQLENTTPLFDK